MAQDAWRTWATLSDNPLVPCQGRLPRTLTGSLAIIISITIITNTITTTSKINITISIIIITYISNIITAITFIIVTNTS